MKSTDLKVGGIDSKVLNPFRVQPVIRFLISPRNPHKGHLIAFPENIGVDGTQGDLAKLENLRSHVCESKGKEATSMGQIIDNSISMAIVTCRASEGGPNRAVTWVFSSFLCTHNPRRILFCGCSGSFTACKSCKKLFFFLPLCCRSRGQASKGGQ